MLLALLAVSRPFLPAPTPDRLLVLAGTVLALVLAVWAASRLAKGPPKPPPLRTPEDEGQRRNDFRVPLGAPAQVLPAGETLPLDGILGEFSAGGATVAVGRRMTAGDRIALTFRVGGEEFRRLAAEVTRCEASGEAFRHELHCRFLHLTGEDEQRLLRAVARRGRERL